jgi:hypothetical protein
MKLSSLMLSSFLFLSAATAQAGSGAASFAPENDLWKEDNLEAIPNVTEETFNAIIDAGLEAYEPLAQKNREKIKVNRLWENSTVNANVRRSGGVVEINMYGGLARREEITPEGFALVLCHELGHAYGGTPYIMPASKLAAEGQADYYGNGTCLNQVLRILPADETKITATNYTMEKCGEKAAANSEDYNVCIRQLSGGQSTANLLAVLMKQESPNYETPDPLVVKKTELSYPKTVQCRLDSYHNGALELPRPACWFKN